MNVAEAELARVVREHTGRLAASLMSLLGDFAAAEDLVSEAVLAALTRWPEEGVPERPRAWLFAVARNRGLDLLRREARYREKLALLRWPGESEPDDRLRLIFTCCHPALPRAAQIALTLRVVCGLTTAQIGSAFLVPESTVAQRITRAKRKITEAGIPYRVPDADELGARLTEVLAVIYLLCNEGYLASGGDAAQRRDLVDDAEWLAALLHGLMPTEPEVAGLLALIRLHRARAAARFDDGGNLVLLKDQDRTRWDHDAIAGAIRLLTSAARHRRPGPYQLQAAIVACHAEAKTWAGHRLAADPGAVRAAAGARTVPGDPAAPGHRVAARGRAGRRARRAVYCGHGAGPVPPLPRHPRGAAARAGPAQGGPRGGPAGVGAHREPGRAGPARATNPGLITWLV